MDKRDRIEEEAALEKGLDLSEKIASAFESTCFKMIEQGVDHRSVSMGLLLTAFDILCVEQANMVSTREVFLALADFVTRRRLDQSGVPNIEGQ